MIKRSRSFLATLALVLIVVLLVTSTIGTANISAAMTAKIIYNSLIGTLQDFLHLLPPGLEDKFLFLESLKPEKVWTEGQERIIMDYRFPRVILAALVGAALSTAGCAMQGLLKNPMADPYIIGMSSGAALGASIALFFNISVHIFAFAFSLVSIFLVYNISKVGRKIPTDTLLLSGIAVGSFLSAITSFMIYINHSRDHVIFWMMGGFWNPSWSKVTVPAVVILFGILMLYRHSWSLNVMLLGEEQAQYLGVDIEWVKRYILVLSALITGVAVSVSGIIGFVGLIIPHIMRILVGPDHRILFPASTLLGAIFLVISDTIARTILNHVIMEPIELPVGIITALFGAPFFIYLLRKRRQTVYA
jgi:iron complex transport system permease protein